MGEAAKTLPKANSLELITAELDGLIAGQNPPALSLELLPAKGRLPNAPNALLRWVQARVKEVGGVEAMERNELAYLRFQADRLLTSEGWCEIPLGRRNVGVKLVAVLNYPKRLPLLLHILTDRTPTGWARRFCGGDFRHGGIVRRNVVEHGLRGLGETDAQTRAALLDALAAESLLRGAGVVGAGPSANCLQSITRSKARSSRHSTIACRKWSSKPWCPRKNKPQSRPTSAAAPLLLAPELADQRAGRAGADRIFAARRLGAGRNWSTISIKS